MREIAQVRPPGSSGTEAPIRNQSIDTGRATDKHKPYLLKLLIGLFIGQLITMTATATVLGSFVNSHGKEIKRLNEKADEAMKTRDDVFFELDKTVKKLEVIADVHNHSIQELQKTVNTPKLSYHNNTLELLTKSLNDQNSSIGRVNEKVLQLKIEHEPDRNIVTGLKSSVRLIEENVQGQNNSILDNSAQLNQLQTGVSVVQKEIQSQRKVLEQLEENHVAVNATVDDHRSRIGSLEFEQTVNENIFSNHTDEIEMLDKKLNDQNSSIQRVNEKVLQLESEHKLDRNIVQKLNASVRLIEENSTADTIILQNYSSRLHELDLEMTLVNELIQTQHNNHEQLKENMTVQSKESFAFNTRLNELEATTNYSAHSLVDHDNRIGQIELGHISESTLNEEQTTQIHGLEEEMNKTWIAIQGFGEGSVAYRSAFAIYQTNPTYDSSSKVLIFQSTRTNIGSHYSTTTGKFTAQYAGLYVFIVNLYKTGVVKCSIRKNGIGVAWANVLADSGNGLNGSSGSILLHLNPGDEVYVGYCENPSIIDNWTTYIGFLLQAD